MSARRMIVAALSEDSYGGIATLADVERAEQLADAHQTEVRREDAALIENAACDADWSATPAYCQGLRAGAELLLAKTTEKATAEATTATPDFFQPGHGYTHRDGTDFLCVAVTVHPQTGERLAMGWRVDSWALHYPSTVGINQWNHEYDGVEPPAGGEPR